MTTIKGNILDIVELGNPILRQKALYVNNFDNVQELIDNMIATVKDQKGLGIAAPQVNSPYQIFILNSYKADNLLDMPERLLPIINPRMVSHSDEIIQGGESCLSIPNKIGKVPRYSSVTLEYMSRNGNSILQETFDGFIARIIQHEYDHLQGLVYLDRVEDKSTIMTIDEFLAKQKST
jgi:peptide deformylase